MDYYVGSNLYSDDALQHYGIPGQKHGVRRSLAALGYATKHHDKNYQPKNRHYGKGEQTKKELREKAKTRRANEKKAKREAVEKVRAQKKIEQEEKSKLTTTQKIEKAVRSGKASEILKYADKMTDKEIKDAAARMGDLIKLRTSAKLEKDAESGWAKIKKISKSFEEVADLAEKTGKSWNKTAKVLNAVCGWDLPLLDLDKGK